MPAGSPGVAKQFRFENISQAAPHPHVSELGTAWEMTSWGRYCSPLRAEAGTGVAGVSRGRDEARHLASVCRQGAPGAPRGSDPAVLL